MSRQLIQVTLAQIEPAGPSPLIVTGEQYGPLAVVPVTQRQDGSPERQLAGWFGVVHIATGRTVPGWGLCLECARALAAALLRVDMDWDRAGRDKQTNASVLGADNVMDCYELAEAAESRCTANPCKPVEVA